MATKKPAAKRATRSSAAPAKRKPAPLSRSAARDALDRATRTIRALQRDDRRHQWNIGRALAPVSELSLFKSRGYLTLDQYIEEALSMSPSTAYQYLRVSEAFGVEMVETFGMEKLDRALQYIARTPEDEKLSELPKLFIEIPDETTNKTDRKRFEDCTLPELRRAVARLAAKDRDKDKDSSEALDEDALVEALEAANRVLDAAVPKRVKSQTEVRVRRSGGESLLDIRGVPLAQVKQALAAVAKVSWTKKKR